MVAPTLNYAVAAAVLSALAAGSLAAKDPVDGYETTQKPTRRTTLKQMFSAKPAVAKPADRLDKKRPPVQLASRDNIDDVEGSEITSEAALVVPEPFSQVNSVGQSVGSGSASSSSSASSSASASAGASSSFGAVQSPSIGSLSGRGAVGGQGSAAPYAGGEFNAQSNGFVGGSSGAPFMQPPNIVGAPLARPSDSIEGIPHTVVPSVGELLPGPYVETGILYLRRETSQDDQFALMRLSGLTVIERNQRSFDLPSEPGVRITIGEPIDCGWYVESTFIGLQEWSRFSDLSGGTLQSSTTTFTDANRLATQFGLSSGQLTAQTVSLSSRFYSAEGNLKWAYSVLPHAYLMFGVRSANIIDRMTVVETGTVGVSATRSVGTIGVMDVRAENPMFGPQLGAETRWSSPTGRWSLDGHVKGAVLWDLAQVRIVRTLSDSPIGGISSTLRRNETSLAGLIDCSFGLSCRITQGFKFRGGYQVLGVLGFASATQQRPPSIFSSLDHDVHTSERALFHGPFATFEWTFGGYN